MKAVLVSIKPEWCDLIADGKKSIEIRKTKPKLELPFKVYIYCTKGDSQFSEGDRFCLYTPPHDTPVNANQSVIGEFICRKIEHIEIRHFTVLGHENRYAAVGDNPDHQWLAKSCLEYNEVADYGKFAPLYGWHISDLVIYDRPKPLSRFTKPYGTIINAFDSQYIQRPPQSWCYVEELENGK